MEIDHGSSPPRSAQDGAGPVPQLDDIVSVNDRGRRHGNKLGPFVVLGGIALVVLIGLLLTLNVVKSRFSGLKAQPATATASSVGLVRTFDTGGAQPLPTAPLATQSGQSSGTCLDGTTGNELRGQDGMVVRNASGQAVRVCANGQVAGLTSPQQPTVQPIPVQPNGARGQHTGVYDAPTPRAFHFSDGAMMLTDNKAGGSSLLQVVTDPQKAVAAAQGASDPLRPRSEGLLTSAPPSSLEAQLTPSRTPMVQAARLTNLNLLLTKGRTIDCGMSMRIISSLAGQASCIVTSSVYSASGKVVLLERGSEAVGEYRSGVSAGQKRLFVLWTRVITPAGVVINLDSPGADELGSTGMTGTVDNHWYKRVGSAFLLSSIEDGIQYEIADQQAKSGGTTFVLSNTAQAGNNMAQKVLDTTINIPPTIYKNQGDRAVIYVARDLDFSDVYTLRAN